MSVHSITGLGWRQLVTVAGLFFVLRWLANWAFAPNASTPAVPGA